ncbi:Eco57I restriction-modification methylase domain-containing protein [Parenemella sanctibonifatiensis]|uniref:Restriction endonuclease n=1 Tax=Parenemella sanctibonifatiensis TaxID=2016505 RepID=A0A255DXN7_9ACTN|nr:Eco57I restriction-modification methylase domain-containing protein [Parenemella sanctibonifatiensis]OYN84024.1 restriction endonuclease [Parenemella sanctibonifatiensis]
MKAHFDRYVPDILDCLAQLSNDEVPTPPKLARDMLDLLPDEVWHDPGLRWLDPFCKSGVFLREVATRLLDGLTEWEPDFAKRRDHIFGNMLFGAAITAMTGVISRRSVYCSADAAGRHSVARFADSAGNLPFIPAEHDFDAKGRCRACGAPKDLERGDTRENHAYSFIHGAYPTQELTSMKFDVIVGNPPYQIDDVGGHRPVPIYHHFVNKAKSLRPRHIVMITQSRWMAGGLGLSNFRRQMLADDHIRVLVDYPVARDLFPSVEIKGGVSYFHWDRDRPGDCAVTLVRGQQVIGPVSRRLDSHDVFVRDSRALSILDKVLDAHHPSFENLVASVRPFGETLRSNFDDFKESPTGDYRVQLVVRADGRRRRVWTKPEYVTNNHNLAQAWKIYLPKAASDGGQRLPDMVIGRPTLGAPHEVCTETYLAIGPFSSEREARSAMSYLRTRTVRYLISLRKLSQDNIPRTFRWVPTDVWDREFSDSELFEKYSLTPEEVALIEEHVQIMPDNDNG